MVDRVLEGRHASEARAQLAGLGARGHELTLDLPVRLDVGAPEPVDRLLGVADDEQLSGHGAHAGPVGLGGIAGREQQQDLGLDRIGVLELVHEQPLVALLEVGADIGVATQQIAGAHQQVE